MAVVVVAFGTQRTAAQGSVTALLISGEKVVGQLASFDAGTVDIRGSSGARRTIPFGDVVLLDFNGSASGLPDSELQAARNAGSDHVLFMRGGRMLQGRVADFISEGGPDARVVFDAKGGGRQELRLDQVDRLYVSQFTDRAYAAAGVRPPSSTAADSSAPGTRRVPGNTRWLDTGLDVRQGERFTLQTSGTVFLLGNEMEAAPAGVSDGSRAGGAPMPDLPLGALIGRVGNGRPFGIGDQTSISMPAIGRLYLGINDDNPSDNQGEFTVVLTRRRR